MGPIGTKCGESHRQGREVTKYREKTILLVLVFSWNLLTTWNLTENRIHWRISPEYIRICYPLLPVIRPTFEENSLWQIQPHIFVILRFCSESTKRLLDIKQDQQQHRTPKRWASPTSKLHFIWWDFVTRAIKPKYLYGSSQNGY